MRLPRLFGKQRAPEPVSVPFSAPLSPDASMAVVGDIHGCDRLLEILLRDISERDPELIVFVGDYIDRGDHSAQVLRRLFNLYLSAPDRHHFVCGNHEEMMLRFLDAPVENASRWLRYGGLQTLASYGVQVSSQQPDEVEAIRLRDSFARAVGAEILGWVRTMPKWFVNGNVAVVHAGANPAKPIREQSDRALLWGHRDFPMINRDDGTWVVYGHTIITDVTACGGRIGVDTGAYATGRLSAVLIDGGHFDILTATLLDTDKRQKSAP